MQGFAAAVKERPAGCEIDGSSAADTAGESQFRATTALIVSFIDVLAT